MVFNVAELAEPGHLKRAGVIFVVSMMSAGSLLAAARVAWAGLKLSALDCLPNGFMRSDCERVAFLPAAIGSLQGAALKALFIPLAVACFAAVVVSIAGVSGVVE